jgi:hypothetical protein
MVMVWVYVMRHIPETWGHANSSPSRVKITHFTINVRLVLNRSIGTISVRDRSNTWFSQ